MKISQHAIREMAEDAFVRAMQRGEVCDADNAAFTHGFIAAMVHVDEELAAFRRHVEVEKLATRALECSTAPVILRLGRPDILDEGRQDDEQLCGGDLIFHATRLVTECDKCKAVWRGQYVGTCWKRVSR